MRGLKRAERGRLEEAWAHLYGWLGERALPLWWEAGRDLAGGFHDRLTLEGRPVPGPKRARVASRQAWVYAQAPRFGWRGPRRAARDHGLEFLETAHRRADGLYAASPGGAPELYDQAFVLLALSVIGPEAESRAEALLARLPAAEGGFAELAGADRLANPNMHLLEAFLAWRRVAGGRWDERAAALAGLARARLIQPASGALPEVFDASWRATSPIRIEPGHQFEWAFLLMDEGAAPPTAALRLIELAEARGVDPVRNIAIDGLHADLTPALGAARLWPQTERARAHLRAAAVTGEPERWSAAIRGLEGLFAYLTPEGTWRDRMNEDGSFVDEPAPASSLYHIVGAALELGRSLRRL